MYWIINNDNFPYLDNPVHNKKEKKVKGVVE